MKNIFSHWAIAFVTLFVLTFIGVKDPQVKEILRLKSFDLLFQSQEKVVSEDIAIIIRQVKTECLEVSQR